MLVSGSATVIIQLDFYTVQLYQGLRTVPEITRQVKLDTLVLIWLTRFNVSKRLLQIRFSNLSNVYLYLSVLPQRLCCCLAGVGALAGQ